MYSGKKRHKSLAAMLLRQTAGYRRVQMQNLLNLKLKKKKDIAALEKKAKDAEKAALKKLMSGAEQYSKQIKKPVGFFETSKAWGWALIKFLFSGVPKLFATAFSIGLLFSLYGFINGDAVTGLRKGLYKTIDLTVPGERVVSEKRDVSSITPEGQEAPAEKSPATAGHNH